MSTGQVTMSVSHKSVSQKFDEAQKLFEEILEGESNTSANQERMVDCIKMFEELTTQVNNLQLFSSNETCKDLQTGYLKFLQLPHFLGSIWQLRMTGDRKEICRISRIYFKDFLKKLYEYEIISELPREVEDDEEEGSGDVEHVKSNLMSAEEKRQRTIAKFKERKELDAKIKELERKKLGDEDLDEEEDREIWLTKLKRLHIDAAGDLENIKNELELIKSMENFKEEDVPKQDHKKTANDLPYKTFIITKNEVQKKVFGVGYPSLPVMTVNEFYEQREAEGGWGPKPDPNKANQPPPEEDENEKEDEDIDNPEKMAAVREWDEYKDEHRTGWGNRHNKS